MSYAETADVQPLLGDLELPSGLDINLYINRAADEIDIALGERYLVPITTTDHFTQRILATANAELAAAHIFLAQASGGEDNRINAYGEHLYNRAGMRLAVYLREKVLPGGEIRPDIEPSGTLRTPAAIYQQDPVSLLIYPQPPDYSYYGGGYRSDHRS